MKLLVTGGLGFLGSNLASYALKRGDDLVVFDNLYRYGSVDNLKWLEDQGDFRFVHGDIRNINDIEFVIKDFLPDAIFHLAGQVAMTTSIKNPRMDFEINTLGTLNVLESVRKYTPSTTIIYSSSNKVYGDLEQYKYEETDTRYVCLDKPNGFDESTPLQFHSPYGCSKGAADQYMLDYARIFGLKTVVFRHSSMYGGRQFATYDQGWIGWFCQKAIEVKKDILKEPFTISGTGKQVRDVLHKDDMVRLYFTAVDKIEIMRGEAFNIGGGMDNSMSLIELFSFLEQLLDIKMTYIKQDKRVGDQRVFVADLTKIHRLVGWTPQIKVRDGIINMVKWVKSIV